VVRRERERDVETKHHSGKKTLWYLLFGLGEWILESFAHEISHFDYLF
jgi:hypothetical protein